MKIKRIHILPVVVFFLLSSCMEDMTPLQTGSFIKFFGSYKADYGSDVCQSSEGEYAILGTTTVDSAFQSATTTLAQMALFITDLAGNQMSGSPIVLESGFEIYGSQLLVLDGGYVLAGTIDSLDGSGDTDIYLVGLSEKGYFSWSASFGGEGDDELYHIQELDNGNLLISGKKGNDGQEDIWLLETNPFGEFEREFVGSNIQVNDESRDTYELDGAYLCLCTYNDPSLGGSDFYLLNLSTSFGVSETKSCGTEGNDFARKLLRVNDVFYIVGNSVRSNGDSEIRIYEFTYDAGMISEIIEFATISGVGADYIAEDALVNSEGEIAICGTYEASDNMDMLLLVVNMEGEVKVEKHFGGSGTQYGKAIGNADDGGLLMTGVNNLDGNKLISFVKTDVKGEL